MKPNDKPRDDKSQDGADFDLERLRARYELRISQVKFDLPAEEPVEASPERLSPPPLELPPLPKKKSYFDDLSQPPASTPEKPPRQEARPQLGLQEEAPPRPPEPPRKAPLEKLPPAAGKRQAILLAAAAAALAAFSGLWFWKTKGPQAPAPYASFPLPLGHMTGLVFRGGTLLTVDTDKQALVAMAADTGRILSREKFPNPSLRGFTWGQESFWSSDLESGFIYRHGPSEPHALINAFPTSRSVSVLHHDGHSLWASDVRSEIVYRYALSGQGSGEKLALQAQYALPGIAVGGFHQAGNLLWVLDSLSRKMLRYSLAGGELSRLEAVDLSSWLAPTSEIAGFAVEDGRLWLIADNPAALHRFELAGLSWEKEKNLP